MNKQLYDRHGNKVFPPSSTTGLRSWVCYNIFHETWFRLVDGPPTLLTGIWDQ